MVHISRGSEAQQTAWGINEIESGISDFPQK